MSELKIVIHDDDGIKFDAVIEFLNKNNIGYVFVGKRYRRHYICFVNDIEYDVAINALLDANLIK